MKKILIIGGRHLHYIEKALSEAGFHVSAHKPDMAIKLLDDGFCFAAIITSPYLQHGSELDRKETDDGFSAGIVIIQKFQAKYHETVFFLFGGNGQGILPESDNLSFLPHETEIKPEKLADMIKQKLMKLQPQ